MLKTDPTQSSPIPPLKRLAALRRELARQGADGFVVPRADCHQNEYVPPSEERLAWLTGFTGSAGLAVVFARSAALFVDGRYTVQAREQSDSSVDCLDLGAQKDWLAAQLKPGMKLALDPWLHTPGEVARFEAAAAAAKAEIVLVAEDPIAAVWRDRPDAPAAPITLHPARLAGETAAKKLKRIAQTITGEAALVSDPHAIAWALNIRGGDVAHTPIPLAFLLARAQGKPTLYIDPRKVDEATRDALDELVTLAAFDALQTDLAAAAARKAQVRFDQKTAPAALVRAFEAAGGTAEVAADPITLMKAVKNAAELKGAHAAQLRDGAALVRFLAWFDAHAETGFITESAAADKLEAFRRETGRLRDLSFPTISAAGAHAALPHYRVTTASDCVIERGLFLLDSGAQYEDGTTDITRTIGVGPPSREMRDRYTRVLKGHIAIARAIFPVGATGAQIDGFARRALWEAGLDYDHGTGHGIGSYLSVHEGPQSISKLSQVALQPGMILSNEPGYYKPGHYGIRLENLVLVEPREIPGGERPMLGFETISFAPFDVRLIDQRLLDPLEARWIDLYHRRVRAELTPLIAPAEKRWLAHVTRALARW